MSFDADFSAVLDEYAKDLGEKAAEDVRRTGTDCARYVRDGAPKDTGEYAKGWRSRFEDDADGPVATVHNSGRRASLSHLLEQGHEQFFMGNDLGYRYPGQPHIEPAYERAAAEMIARMHG